MIKEGNVIQKDYKKEIAAAKRAEAIKLKKQIEEELRAEKEAEMMKQRDKFAQELDNAKEKLQADIGAQIQEIKD